MRLRRSELGARVQHFRRSGVEPHAFLGEPVPDPDMSHRGVTAIEMVNPGDQISNYITMGNDQCRVRLHCTIAADTVHVQH